MHSDNGASSREREDGCTEAEARFMTFMAPAGSVAVQGHSLDGTTIFWNHASETLYGYRKSEAIGRNILNLIIPETMKSEVRHAIASMCASGKAIPSSQLRLRRKDGSAVDVFSSHAIIKNIQGFMNCFVWIWLVSIPT